MVRVLGPGPRTMGWVVRTGKDDGRWIAPFTANVIAPEQALAFEIASRKEPTPLSASVVTTLLTVVCNGGMVDTTQAVPPTSVPFRPLPLRSATVVPVPSSN